MKRKITIGDITMKQAADKADYAFSFREKIELAKMLDKTGLSVIELAPITDGKTDSLLIKSLTSAVKNSILRRDQDLVFYTDLKGLKDSRDDIGDNIYDGFLSVTNGVWDYSKSDKIIIPDNGESTITINNVYNGCCGMICTTKNLALPSNSDKSIDFNYINAGTNQYYMYTFVYGTNVITNTNKYIWNRTVITT